MTSLDSRYVQMQHRSTSGRGRRVLSRRAISRCFLSAALLAAGLAVPAGEASAAPIGATTADFNGDGYGDLAASSSGSKGAVNVLYGSADGLTSSGSQRWTQDSTGIPDSAESLDSFGRHLATGDFNGDGFTDLAVGNELENTSSLQASGAVTVIYGSSAGLTSTGAQIFSQDSSGILGTAEANDQFSDSLAAGNLGNGPQDDLVVAAPSETLSGVEGQRHGVVHVIYGSPTGLTSAGNQMWSQNSPGVGDSAEGSDYFGETLAVADFGNGTTEDLAIGVPEEDFEFIGRDGLPTELSSTGLVHVLYGSASGVTATGSQVWSQQTPNVLDAQEGGEHFGSALAAADFGNGAQADLAVGVRGEDQGGGAVNTLYGSSSGLGTAGNQFWNQDSAGIIGGTEAGDGFGEALAAGNVGNGAQPDLVIGVPNEDFTAGLTNDGVVQVIFAGSTGLVSTGNQLWSQDSAGISGTAESSEFFGANLMVNNYGRSVEGDIAVGVYLEDFVAGLVGDGIVELIYGSLPGPTATGNQIWSLDSAGIPGTATNASFFGEALG